MFPHVTRANIAEVKVEFTAINGRFVLYFLFGKIISPIYSIVDVDSTENSLDYITLVLSAQRATTGNYLRDPLNSIEQD